ncbi:MAG: hypothetical protein Q7J57_06300 [Gemmobacter sp.]|nr:hypothetical protein [Gemmobacter sp.]
MADPMHEAAMLRRLILSMPLIFAAALPLHAEPAPVASLYAALDLERLVAVLHSEGVKYGDDLEDELFGGAGGARWDAIVADVHDQARMKRILTDRLSTDLAGQEAAVARMVTFLEADPGKRIVALELSAREALLEDSVRDAAEINWQDMLDEKEPRTDLIRRFSDVNDLIEMNVAGGMNSNLAFFKGMVAGGAPDPALNETDMMADLWAQEPRIRQDTEDWLFPYLAMAYQPLSDADLDAYIAFSESPEGQMLNAALFAAFDVLFVSVSQDLGFAAARFAQGEDL